MRVHLEGRGRHFNTGPGPDHLAVTASGFHGRPSCVQCLTHAPRREPSLPGSRVEDESRYRATVTASPSLTGRRFQ
ncbi:hypothetical protein GCM10008997_10400 [Halomonas salifodinae]